MNPAAMSKGEPDEDTLIKKTFKSYTTHMMLLPTPASHT